MHAKKTGKTKLLAVVLAMVLVFGCAAGGTLAWLMAKTDPVINTFTVGDINIELKETTGSNYKIVPGSSQAKDPTVTVKAGSEECYVYVLIDNTVVLDGKVVATPNLSSDWIEVASSDTKTLYRYKDTVDLSNSNEDLSLPVFTEVSYSEDIEKGDIDTLNGTKIIVTAYAHQTSDKLDLTTINDNVKALAGIS